MRVDIWVHSVAFGSFKARTLAEDDLTAKGESYAYGVQRRTPRAVADLEKELDRRSDFKYRIEVKEVE